MYLTPQTNSSKPSSGRQTRLENYLRQQKTQLNWKTRFMAWLKHHTPKVRLPQIFFGLAWRRVGVIVLSAAILSGGAFALWNYITIQKVQLEGSVDIRLAGIDDLLTKSTLTTTRAYIQQVIESKNPSVFVKNIEFVLPQTVIVRFEYRKPIVFVRISDNNYIQLDARGVVVSIVHEMPSSNAQLHYYQKLMSTDYHIGSILEYSDVQFALQLAQHVHELWGSHFDIYMHDSALLEIVLGHTTITATTKDSHVRQLNALREMLETVRHSGEVYKKIDIRFDRVITEK